MKMRKKLAAVLAAAMIASVMPMTTFAASTNRLTKDNVHIKKDTELTTANGVELVVQMKDGDEFTSPEIFYLKLEDAEWSSIEKIAAGFHGDGFTVAAVPNDTDAREVSKSGVTFIVRRDNKKELAVMAVGTIDDTKQIRIPVRAKVTGDEPTVTVDPFDSTVSASKFAIAVSATGKALVTVGSTPTIAGTDEMASITFDEPFIGAFREDSNGNKKVEIELRDTDFTFTSDSVTLKGTKAFRGYNISAIPNGSGNLVFTIDSTRIDDINQRGGFTLEGVKVKPNRNAREGDVKATLSGSLVDKQQIVVAKYGDFTTTLKVAKDDYSVVAGKELEVEFTLAEEMANALIGNRTVNFAFSKDIIVEEVEVVEAKELETGKDKGDINIQYTTITHKDSTTSNPVLLHTNEFSVDEFFPNVEKKSSYKFKANLLVPAGYEGDITLTAEGRGLEDKKEVVVAKTEAPVTVEAKAATVKVGLKTQATDAKIVIKETKEDRITKGEDIIVSIADRDSGLEFVDADIKVTEGDLELDKDNIEVEDGRIIIPVKRHSTEPSTIEITDIEIKSDRTVPQGSYDVKVGGSAISDFTTNIHFGDKKSAHNSGNTALAGAVLDAVATVEDFIVVGTPNTEDINKGKKAEVNFVIGSNKYLVDGKEVEMDAAPYIKDGRTMVPLRALATALGVDAESIKFNAGVVTLFKEDGKVIQVKVGSKDLTVNGMVIPMVAAAEVVEGRTFVPVTEIGGVFGVAGSWDAATQTATFK